MRRALATATIAGAIALVPFTATAYADDALAGGAVLTTSETDTDEPLAEDGNDDTGKYGLIGLTGLFGLFGYKKYRDHRATRSTTDATGTTGTDGSSRRV
ncbi:MAG: hypothetical protein JWN08_3352 [Frankiales bacterium]|jgi:hypothetical protein|nr:hypothetical protein [Frankiales bacterium]